ncbi:MAG: OPT family oligopeptide transporter [Verrucomicrobiota bacterium]
MATPNPARQSSPTETTSAESSSLPDLTRIAPEERDRVWFRTYFRGEGTPQLTLRAVLMGGILGALMSVSNLYTTLKLGWAFGVAITACVLSYALWNAFVAAGLARTRMTLLENNCMQSTASAAGYSTGGTMAAAVGALLLISGDAGRLGWLPVGLWVLFTALLGVFLAIPMKRQMINHDQLPFPSGIAAAETLRSLYAQGRESVLKARALILSLAVGVVSALFRSFGYIPEQLFFNQTVAQIRGQVLTGKTLGMWFEPSLLLIAAGMIVGIRVSSWMLVGATINYLVLAPQMAGLSDWSEPGKSFFGHLEASLGDGGIVKGVKLTRWSLWLGTSILVASGLTSFAVGYRTILRAIRGMRGGGTGPASAEDQAMQAIEVPTRWLVLGGVPITLGLVLLCWLAFGIAPWLGLLSVVLSFVLALVACRATGETDTTPIGAMGKITQFVYAVLAPANTSENLITAGVTAGAAGSSADLLTDLKSGYLLGAHPRKQFLAQFYGVFFGTLAVVPAWYILVPNQAALEAFNSPATSMWYAVAQALSRGIETIPSSARLAIVVGGLVGVALSLLEALTPERIRRWVPSAMGLGLSFVVPFANSLSFFIGALLAVVWTRVHRSSADRYIIPVASGAVAGESLASAAYAILAALGLAGGH